MKVCVVLIGQPRSFELASISLRQVFEKKLRPEDEIYYMPVFWDFNSSYFENKTVPYVWDQETLYKLVETSYGKDHLIGPTILSLFDAHNYLGGFGYTVEDILYRSEDWGSRYKFTTLHQLWLFKKAIELFEQDLKQKSRNWDLVIVTRPDLVFFNSDVDYGVLEERLQYLKEHFTVDRDRWIGFHWHTVNLSTLPLTGVRNTQENYRERAWLDDKIAIGTSCSVVLFFKTVWKMYVDHLVESFEDPVMSVTYPEELWALALLYARLPLVNVFEQTWFTYDVLRDFTVKYPKFKELIKRGKLQDFAEKYSQAIGPFIFMTEQDYLKFRKNEKSNLV